MIQLIWGFVLSLGFATEPFKGPCYLYRKTSTVRVKEWKGDLARVLAYRHGSADPNFHCDPVGEISSGVEKWVHKKEISKINLKSTLLSDPCGTFSEYPKLNPDEDLGTAWAHRSGCTCAQFEMYKERVTSCKLEKPEAPLIVGDFCQPKGDFMVCRTSESARLCQRECFKWKSKPKLTPAQMDQKLKATIFEARQRVRSDVSPKAYHVLERNDKDWIPLVLIRSWVDPTREYEPKLRPFLAELNKDATGERRLIILYFNSVENLTNEIVSWIEIVPSVESISSKGTLPNTLITQDPILAPEFCVSDHLPNQPPKGSVYLMATVETKTERKLLNFVKLDGVRDGKVLDITKEAIEAAGMVNRELFVMDFLKQCQKLKDPEKT